MKLPFGSFPPQMCGSGGFDGSVTVVFGLPPRRSLRGVPQSGLGTVCTVFKKASDRTMFYEVPITITSIWSKQYTYTIKYRRYCMGSCQSFTVECMIESCGGREGSVGGVRRDVDRGALGECIVGRRGAWL